jgi:hypothetical protein
MVAFATLDLATGALEKMFLPTLKIYRENLV